MQLWLKLNIYPLMLSVISVSAGVMAFFIPQFRERDWIFYSLLVCAFVIMQQSVKIFSRYGEKLLLMKRLIRSGRKKFDHRCFYPYMESPCMRHVVYFSLSELNRTEDYRTIKKHHRKKSTVIFSPNPKIVRLIFENHQIKTMPVNQTDRN